MLQVSGGVESVARQLREAVETAQAPLPPLFPVTVFEYLLLFCYMLFLFFFGSHLQSFCIFQYFNHILKDGRGRVCARASESAVVAARELGGGR